MSDYARLISQQNRKARKQYHCDAFELMQYEIGEAPEFLDRITAEEKAAFEKALSENGRILKGSLYLCQTCEFDGIIYRFRARPEIWEICKKYRLSMED